MFTGSDGVQYGWALEAMGMNLPKVCLFFTSLGSSTLNHGIKLVTTDGKKTAVAEFHRARSFTKKQKVRLEIQAVRMGILDHIVLPFVFAENKRREREGRAKSSGGG